jgi:hypothetical protein
MPMERQEAMKESSPKRRYVMYVVAITFLALVLAAFVCWPVPRRSSRTLSKTSISARDAVLLTMEDKEIRVR